MDVNEISLGLTRGENSDNMAAKCLNDDTLFDNKDKIIYDNSSFNRSLFNETVRDRSTNQQDLENVSRQLNEGKELEKIGDESILSEINTDFEDSTEKIDDLETDENTKRSTRKQISTKPSEGVF